MKPLVAITAVLAIVPIIQGLVCYSGQRVTVKSSNDVTISGNWQGQDCNQDQKCATSVFYRTNGMTEYGRCVSSSASTPACAAIASSASPPISNFHNCSTKQCTTFGCNAWKLPANCTATPPQGDVQILPGCTLKTTLSEVGKCINPIIAGFPYSDLSSCQANYKKAFVCGISLLTRCLSKHCPTALDLIPVPLASQYAVVLLQAKQLKSLDAIFSMTNVDAAVQQQIWDSLCLQRDSIYLKNLTYAAATVNAMENFNINRSIRNPVCDSNIVKDLYQWSLQSFPKLLVADTHAKLCTEMNVLLAKVKNAWQTRCKRDEALKLLKQLIPPQYSPLNSQVETSFDIVESYVLTYQLPACVAGATAAPAETTSAAVANHMKLLHSLYAGSMGLLAASKLF